MFWHLLLYNWKCFLLLLKEFKNRNVCLEIKQLRKLENIGNIFLSVLQITLNYLRFSLFTSGEREDPVLVSFIFLSYIFLSYLILSYLILSYLILSYLILSYLILSYLILSYLILSYLILYYLILSYHILSYLILSYLILSYIILGKYSTTKKSKVQLLSKPPGSSPPTPTVQPLYIYIYFLLFLVRNIIF